MEDTYTFLLDSARSGRVSGLVAAIEASGDAAFAVNCCDELQQTPLHLACGKGYIDCVRLLLSCPGISLNVQSNTGVSPLVMAAVKGHDKVVALLLQQEGVDPNHVGYRGRGAVHGAARHGHIEVLRVLMADDRVDINVTDDEGRSALVDAARTNRRQIVVEMLQCPRLETASIAAARVAATEAGHPNIAQLLIL